MKTLYWIDDTHDQGKPPNAAARQRLERGLGVQLKVVEIEDRGQFDKLLPTIDGTNTCGVILDYQLTKVGASGQMAFGSTWAAEIRAAWPSVPVIGISHERESDIPKLRLESFLAFFPRDQLMGAQPPLKDTSALLVGYSQIWQTFKSNDGKSGVERMVDLVKPPGPVADLVRAAIPPLLRGSWDVESPHMAGRWLWHELQGRPGFLFDELGLATHLGLNLNGPGRVLLKFDAARYGGAFASDARPRWWVTAIRSIFEKLVGKQVMGPISNSRDELLEAIRVAKSERIRLLARAHPRKSFDEIPDCVAYRDELREGRDRVQALFNETSIDDRDKNPPFGFEARRIYDTSQRK